jgi:uncharacterized circularly permuted ATP-grasp superfamily protein
MNCTTLDGAVREIYRSYAAWLDALPEGTLERKSAEAELLFRRLGITFAVYGQGRRRRTVDSL